MMDRDERGTEEKLVEMKQQDTEERMQGKRA